MKSRVLPFLIVCLAPCVALQAAAAAKSSNPNFIVILSDDQSWVGTSQRMIPGDPETASDYFRTPNIERLAAQGDDLLERLLARAVLLPHAAESASFADAGAA